MSVATVAVEAGPDRHALVMPDRECGTWPPMWARRRGKSRRTALALIAPSPRIREGGDRMDFPAHPGQVGQAQVPQGVGGNCGTPASTAIRRATFDQVHRLSGWAWFPFHPGQRPRPADCSQESPAASADSEFRPGPSTRPLSTSRQVLRSTAGALAHIMNAGSERRRLALRKANERAYQLIWAESSAPGTQGGSIANRPLAGQPCYMARRRRRVNFITQLVSQVRSSSMGRPARSEPRLV